MQAGGPSPRMPRKRYQTYGCAELRPKAFRLQSGGWDWTIFRDERSLEGNRGGRTGRVGARAGLPELLALAAAVGSGLVAGVFFAFSTFVMRALARLPAPQGIAAMQAINVVVINPMFLGAFFGTAALALILTAVPLLRWEEPGAFWLLAAGVLYLAGSLLVTVVCNVPRNKALAALAPDAPEGAALWRGYVREWTAWNHMRSAAALAASAAFSIRAARLGQAGVEGSCVPSMFHVAFRGAFRAREAPRSWTL